MENKMPEYKMPSASNHSESVSEQIAELKKCVHEYFEEVLAHLDKHDERLKDYVKEFEKHRKKMEKHVKNEVRHMY